MKRFQFRLGRVLDWRRTELDLEESRLKQLHASIALLERERAELEAAGDHASRALLTQAAVDGTELHALSAYRAALKLQAVRLNQKRRERQADLAAQQQTLLEARRRLRLLENLKERRRVEWSYETERQERADQNGPFRAPRKIALPLSPKIKQI
jgi:flagellar export protein FliJ